MLHRIFSDYYDYYYKLAIWPGAHRTHELSSTRSSIVSTTIALVCGADAKLCTITITTTPAHTQRIYTIRTSAQCAHQNIGEEPVSMCVSGVGCVVLLAASSMVDGALIETTATPSGTAVPRSPHRVSHRARACLAQREIPSPFLFFFLLCVCVCVVLSSYKHNMLASIVVESQSTHRVAGMHIP